ncbi:ThiF family adenylyltransferase [Ammoniphilus resinae]|uniref:THIF-type NAD/FAD binding fold domain-containing protein n=1 Tax=Ammoniphilus resinae TaxID=861532 RepID=A0ABS4GXX7_9BACL|nr:ThiF family adenylyltransferase [Ammoniphilus resinae]MBP1935130.1 hypothetical protein [Ammoniphilus resinae]
MANPLLIKQKDKNYTIFKCVLVGTGANGSHFFRGLCQMIRTYLDKEKGRASFHVDLTIVDADRVEAKNIGNQLFDGETDIGEKKVIALADRYGEHYQLDIKRVTEYVKDLDMLRALFTPEEVGKNTQVINILIGMVDNNRSRQLFDSYFFNEEVKDLIWIDAGVEGIEVLNKPEHEYTPEDWEVVHSSGYGGQVVAGVKVKGQVLLEPVTRVYRNILEDAATAFPGESCGALIINNPQRCMTNQMAAQIACTYMNNLLYTGTIYTHYVNFNSQHAGSRPVFIKEEIIQKCKEL